MCQETGFFLKVWSIGLRGELFEEQCTPSVSVSIQRGDETEEGPFVNTSYLANSDSFREKIVQ